MFCTFVEMMKNLIFVHGSFFRMPWALIKFLDYWGGRVIGGGRLLNFWTIGGCLLNFRHFQPHIIFSKSIFYQQKKNTACCNFISSIYGFVFFWGGGGVGWGEEGRSFEAGR